MALCHENQSDALLKQCYLCSSERLQAEERFQAEVMMLTPIS